MGLNDSIQDITELYKGIIMWVAVYIDIYIQIYIYTHIYIYIYIYIHTYIYIHCEAHYYTKVQIFNILNAIIQTHLLLPI